MRKNRRSLIIAIALFLLISLTIGYAAINSKLNINGLTNIDSNSWIIYFDNIKKQTGTNIIEPTEEAEIKDLAKTKIEFAVDLKEPGEKYEFLVDIKNDGTINAVVDSVVKEGLTEANEKYLDFQVTYVNGGAPIKECDRLLAKSKRQARVVVSFKEDVKQEDLPKENTETTLSFTINYVQDDGRVCPTLYINPNGGTYNGSSELVEIDNLKSGSKVPIEDVIPPSNKDFKGWEAKNDENYETIYDEETKTVTIGTKNAYLTAQYDFNVDYVARIEQTYYETIQAAFDAAKEGDMIYLLKNTTESPTTETKEDITLNLDGY